MEPVYLKLLGREESPSDKLSLFSEKERSFLELSPLISSNSSVVHRIS